MVPITLSDLERREATGQIFPAYFHNCDRIVWRRRPNLEWWRCIFLRGQLRPQSYRRGPRVNVGNIVKAHYKEIEL